MEARTLASIELPGLVSVRGAWFYVLGTIAEFVLDYPSYDPSYNPSEWDHEFRGGLLCVSPEDGFAYLAQLSEQAFGLSAMDGFIALNGPGRSRPVVLIDFDRKKYVSTYFDQPMQDHAGTGWVSEFAEPLGHAPTEVAQYWGPVA